MTKPGLQRPRVMAGVRQRVTAAVTEHVRMDGISHASALAEAREQRSETLRAHRAAALGGEHMRARALFTL
jgi:hypothetical protein